MLSPFHLQSTFQITILMGFLAPRTIHHQNTIALDESLNKGSVYGLRASRSRSHATNLVFGLVATNSADFGELIMAPEGTGGKVIEFHRTITLHRT